MKAPRRAQVGATLIEVLMALLISVFGVLGMMALQMRAYAAEGESYQRANAAILLEDIANRIVANGPSAADYVASDVGIGPAEDCSSLANGPQRDLCDWGNLLRGSAETSEGNLVGAMLQARACISSPEPDVYVVAIVWQGVNPTGAPGTACGRDEYDDEALRRAVTTIVRIGRLDT